MKNRIVGLLLAFSLLVCSGIFCSISAAAGKADGAKLASGQGVMLVQGEVAVVEVVVAVDAGEKDPQGKARAALQRMYPEVVPVRFALTGLDWDVFHDDDPMNDKVPVNYNGADAPAYLAGSDHLGVLLGAMAVWTDVPSSIFVFEFNGMTDRAPSLVKESRGRQLFDGNNDVAWLNIKEPSVLAVTWYGTQTDEFDMAVDAKDFAWFVGADPALIGPNEFDLQTVLTHELGHAVGLDHSDVEGSIMQPYYEGARRELSQDDIDGVTTLYPAEGADVPPEVLISGPADGSIFDIGSVIAFEGVAGDEDEDLTAFIEWSSDLEGYLGTGGSISATLTVLGTHVVTASAVDSEGRSGSDAVIVIVRDPAQQSATTVESVTYATSGGRYQDRDLYTAVRVIDDTGQAVNGAAVAIRLVNAGVGSWIGSGVTIDNGTVTFKLRNAPAGTYTAEVTGVDAAGLVWDGITPPNSFEK